jgi:DNA-binding MurR/RpiR family transcriptional regulator
LILRQGSDIVIIKIFFFFINNTIKIIFTTGVERMGGILQAICEKRDSLHNKERRLADFILEHSHSVARMSITELAELSSTSPSTVSRFCRHFHFAGYTDFRMKLAAETARQPERPATYQDIEAGRPLDQIITAIEANYTRMVAETARLADPKSIARVVDALLEARRIDLYGVATSGLVAGDFHQKLVRVGLNAFVSSDPHMQITMASNLQPGDVAFAVSYSGETPETIDALDCAKQQGAVAVSLTKFGTNTLASIADIPLFTSPLEEGIRRGDMASRIGQLQMIDILFTSMLSRRFDELVPQLERSFQLVHHYRKDREGSA